MTEAELLAGVREAEAQLAAATPGVVGITTAELGRHWGIDHRSARTRVAELVAAGLLRPVKVRRPRIDGIMLTVTGWVTVAPTRRSR